MLSFCISVCGNDDDSGTDTDTGNYNPDCTAFVDGEVEESGDGWSWESAVKTVQEGIDLAYYGATEVGICDQWEVWVKQGTYYIYQDDRENTVQLKEQVALLGGFDGTETAEFDRDWEANVTSLDGRDGADGENHVYHVVTGANEATLDGFTVTGGRADDEVYESERSQGGGLIVRSASPTITNCVFADNKALEGGGIFAEESNIDLSNCIFENNSANLFAGAICLIDSSATLVNIDFTGNVATMGSVYIPTITESYGGALVLSETDATLENCKMVGNTVFGDGGGMRIGNNCVVSINECEFTGNKSFSTSITYSFGGAIHASQPSTIKISNTLFENNFAQYGGGIGGQQQVALELYRVRFENNTTGFGGGPGGGLFLGGCTAAIAESTFYGNSATWGGGLSIADSTATVSNSLFEANVATTEGGGAIHFSLAETTYTNCVFLGNTVDEGPGGAIWSGSSITDAINCTFYDNSAQAGGAVYSTEDLDFGYGYQDDTSIINSIFWNNSPSAIEWDKTEPNVTFSDVEGGFKGKGNIDADPLFVDSANSDLHLESDSPCIGAASPEYAPETDFDGSPRDDEPDMGAFEYQ